MQLHTSHDDGFASYESRHNDSAAACARPLKCSRRAPGPAGILHWQMSQNDGRSNSVEVLVLSKVVVSSGCLYAELPSATVAVDANG